MTNLARLTADSAPGRAAERNDPTHFCTHCGSLFDPSEGNGERTKRRRVCAECGLGVILTCAKTTLDSEGAVFLVVTSDLRISAASEAAEGFFRIPEGLYGRPLLSVVTSPDGVGDLARQVVRAASGSRQTVTMPVEAASSRLPAGAIAARIGGCASPPAALLVIETVRA